MERRFAVRYEQLMAEAEVKPAALEGVLKRLDEFVKPFAASLKHDAQRQHAAEYVAGLVSNVKRKNIETIAYLHEQDRQPMQKFIGQRPWDEGPMIDELVRQVAASIGRADGVLVIDPSGVLKQGKASVGVARQWCGRAGKVDNCQVGVYMAYVSRDEQALVDARLYLPKEWTKDKRRCRQAGIPREIKFRTRHELAIEMIRNHRAMLPHTWVTGDDEMGRNSGFRDEFAHHERAVSSGCSVEYVDPRSGRCSAAVPRFGRTAESSVSTRGQMDEIREAVVSHRGSAGREGAAGHRSFEGSRANEAWASQRSRRDVGDFSRTTRPKSREARLCLVERTVRRRHCGSSPACLARSIGWKSVFDEPRGNRAWRSIKCERGVAGIIIKRSP